MKFVLTAPVSEINENSDILIRQIIVWIFLVVGVSVFISIYMTRTLVKPLLELNIAAKKIAAGDLNVSLTYQSKDELGTVSESFRQTAEHLKHYIDYINGLAYRDLLTGVKNRTAYLQEELKLNELIKLGCPEFAVIVFDLNNLKLVNDTRGHELGDLLIVNSSKIISKAFQTCPVYRIGGDEFVVILEGPYFQNKSDYLQTFGEELASYNQLPINGIKLSIARGVAVYSSKSDSTFSDVFTRADNAMYQNKSVMKNL